MPKKKPPKEEPQGTPSLREMGTKDLLRSIREDLAEKARQSALARPEDPPKPPRSR